MVTRINEGRRRGPGPRFGSVKVSESSVKRSEIITLFEDQVLDDDPTTVNSFDDGPVAGLLRCEPWDSFKLILEIDSTLAPTDIEFFVEFTDDEGTNWYGYAEGLFASLIYDDVNVASIKRQVFEGPVQLRDMRLRVAANGTNATNFFTFTAKVQFVRE